MASVKQGGRSRRVKIAVGVVFVLALLTALGGCTWIQNWLNPNPPSQNMTEDEARTILDLQASGAEKYNELKQQNVPDAISQVVDWFKTQPRVQDSGVSSDGTIWTLYNCGLEALLPTAEPKPTFHVGTSSLSGSGPDKKHTIEDIPVVPAPASITRSSPGNRKAILLLPFYWDKKETGAEEVELDLQSINYDIKRYDSQKVTLNLLTTLGEYGVIYIVTHGYIGREGANLASGEKVLSPKGLIHVWKAFGKAVSLVVPIHGMIPYLAINKYFIENLHFPDSLVFVNACHSLGDFQLANAFLDSGAAVYFGWTDKTYIAKWFSGTVTPVLFDLFVKPNVSIEEAYNTPAVYINTDKPGIYSINDLYPITLYKDEDHDNSVNACFSNAGCSWNDPGERNFWYQLDFTYKERSDIAGFFLNPDSPPTVTITSPADGSTFNKGDTITFTGSATDPEDGALTGSSLVWTSSIDGQIGTGESFTKNDLSVGTHTITLTATDSEGATGTASVTITVSGSGGNKPPVHVPELLPPFDKDYFSSQEITLDLGYDDAIWYSTEGDIIGDEISGLDESLVLLKKRIPVDFSRGDLVIEYKFRDTFRDLSGDASHMSLNVILNPPDSGTFWDDPFEAGEHGTLNGDVLNFLVAFGPNENYGGIVGVDDTVEGGGLPRASADYPNNGEWVTARIRISPTGDSVEAEGDQGYRRTENYAYDNSGLKYIAVAFGDQHRTKVEVEYIKAYYIEGAPSPNQPPTVTITSPADGSTFNAGDPIAFQGSATDPEDGALTGSSLVWTSSIDGQIGTGESFTRSDLSVGTHTITLTATDSQGATAAVNVTIVVNETAPPEAAKGKIAFVSDRDDDADIFVMNTDGSDQRNITNDPNNWDEHPAWSPDGTKIAFTSDRHGRWHYEIYVMNADGSDQRNITNAHPYNAPAYSDRDPAWSPDGTKIAFASSRDGNWEIYVMNADGSDQRNITNDPDYDDRSPAWSPDGTKIAFISNRDGPSYNFDIYVMNADGSDQRNITNSSQYNDGSPAWSPDGTKIAFHSWWASYWDREASNIYVMDADGSNVQTLTNTPSDDRDPAWSPDGTKIAFRSGSADIFVMNADGTNPRNITNDPDNWDWEPAWSPVLP